jgi:hypothetical protein
MTDKPATPRRTMHISDLIQDSWAETSAELTKAKANIDRAVAKTLIQNETNW